MHDLSLLTAFPRLQRSGPPATTCQVAEDSLPISVGRRAPEPRTRANSKVHRHRHERAEKEKELTNIQSIQDKSAG